MEERRRSPRQQAGSLSVNVPVTESVRVLDVSRAGLLLHSVSRPAIGSRATLRLSIGGQPLVAEVEVKRVVQAHGGFHVGVRFVELTPGNRQLIERFIGQ